jgi:hypothetical protein
VLLARLPATAEREVAAAAIGLGAISHAVMALGLCGALGRWLPIAAIALALALAWKLRPSRAWWIALAALPLVLIALQPPTAWDATEFHLALVKEYVRTGHVAPVERLRYPVFAQLEEMLFALGFQLGGERAPALVETLFAALTALALWAFGRRWFSPRAGVAAAALWLASPMIVFLATAAYVDVGLCCFATLATLALGAAFVEDPEQSDRWLAVAGALAGFAASCKYLGLPFLAGLGLATLARRRPRATLAFALAALPCAAPWYIYNFIYTKNPIFPFAGEIFGYGGAWSAADLAAQMREMHSHGVGRSPVELALLPWTLMVEQSRFQVEAPFLPVLLPALALAAWGALRSTRIRALLFAVVAYGIFWFSTVQLLRYLVPASALLSLAIAAAADPLLARVGPRLRLAALALLLAPSLVYIGSRVRDGLPLGDEARRQFLTRAIPDFAAVDFLNRTRGSDWRAYQFQLERLQFFADGTLYGDWFGPWRYHPIFPLLDNPPALADKLRSFGVEYLLLRSSDPPLHHARFEALAPNVYRIR